MNVNKRKISNNLFNLFNKFPIDIVYLYGSVASGKNDYLSDWDFGILFRKHLQPTRRFNLRLQLFESLASKLNISEERIDVVDLLEVPLLLKFNVICGKLLYCINEERRVKFESYVMALYHDQHHYYDECLRDTLSKIENGVYFDHHISYA